MIAVPAEAFTLTPHPSTPCPAVSLLTAELDARRAGAWHLRYRLVGELARLRIAAPAQRPAATEGLWRHTCFEAFIAAGAAPAYREYNFSPSANWAVFDFRAERERVVRPAATAPTLAPTPAPESLAGSASPEPQSPPRVRCTHDAHALLLDAWFTPPAGARAGTADTHGLLGLAAVLESADGRLSYWALGHPAARPDFHQRAGWLPLLIS